MGEKLRWHCQMAQILSVGTIIEFLEFVVSEKEELIIPDVTIDKIKTTEFIAGDGCYINGKKEC